MASLFFHPLFSRLLLATPYSFPGTGCAIIEHVMFRPGDRVHCQRDGCAEAALLLRISYPFRKEQCGAEPVEFSLISEPMALVRFEDGGELLVPFSEIQPARPEKAS
jgi:hypothetical protein